MKNELVDWKIKFLVNRYYLGSCLSLFDDFLMPAKQVSHSKLLGFIVKSVSSRSYSNLKHIDLQIIWQGYKAFPAI